MKFIQFEPIYKERVWGGRRLERSLGRSLPDSAPYGESWEIVDRQEDQSVVLDGSFKGLTIRQLLEQEGDYVMGPDWPKGKFFPILVKWLDCRERLSLQVHPPKEMAKVLGGDSKTENWYIAEADPGAEIVAGLTLGATRESFEKSLKSEQLEPLLHTISTEQGDSQFIPSGRLHAIGGGHLILEIQENSDTTYRVYDWGRLGLDGHPRELHVRESLESTDFEDLEPSKVSSREEDVILADCDEFRIQKKVLGSEGIDLESDTEPRLVSVVEGELDIIDAESTQTLTRGTNILLPYGESFRLDTRSICTILVTDKFI